MLPGLMLTMVIGKLGRATSHRLYGMILAILITVGLSADNDSAASYSMATMQQFEELMLT